jgi:ubiquilin
MLNAAQEQFGSNPFAALSGEQQSQDNSGNPTRTENREPLPNPWARNTPGSTTNASPNPTGLNSGTSPLLGSSGGMASLMQQMMDNPQV